MMTKLKRYIPIGLFLLTIILGFSSCDAFKKAQNGSGDRVELDPITGKPIKKNKKNNQNDSKPVTFQRVDTIQWTKPIGEASPISSDGISYTNGNSTTNNTDDPNTDDPSTNVDPIDIGNSPQYDAYNVAVLLPFMTDRFNIESGKVYERSKIALQLYGGMKLAAKELENEGVNLSLDVMDTRASESTVISLLESSAVQNAHLIIGPVRKNNVVRAATFAKKEKTPFVSPLSPSMGLSDENPYYLQLSPSLKSHCEAITRHIRERYETEQVVLVCRDKSAEKKRLQYFHDANFLIEGKVNNDLRFREYIITGDETTFNDIDVTNYLSLDKKTVFVVPSWSSESFVNAFLRVVRIAKTTHDVVVYGMPQWMKYNRISYDYYEDLEVHVSSDTYIDLRDNNVKNFRRSYFDTYGELPDENAYLGYDMLKYFALQLKDNGSQFQRTIDQSPQQMLHTKFSFEPISTQKQTTGTEDFTIDQYENTHVNILKYKNYFFQPAN